MLKKYSGGLISGCPCVGGGSVAVRDCAAVQDVLRFQWRCALRAIACGATRREAAEALTGGNPDMWPLGATWGKLISLYWLDEYAW